MSANSMDVGRPSVYYNRVEPSVVGGLSRFDGLSYGATGGFNLCAFSELDASIISLLPDFANSCHPLTKTTATRSIRYKRIQQRAECIQGC